MDKALFIAMTGAKHNMLAQANRANNLANVSTTGFRADFEQSRSMGVYYGDGQPTRAYAMTESPRSDFTSGPMIQTNNPLDAAIQGNGFFVVQAPDGTEAYTRAGNFAVDATGVLRTANGLVYETSVEVDLVPPVDGAAEKKILVGNNPIIINR